MPLDNVILPIVPSRGGICFSIPLHLGWLFYLLRPIGYGEKYVVGLLSFGFKRPSNFLSCLSGMLLPPEEARLVSLRMRYHREIEI